MGLKINIAGTNTLAFLDTGCAVNAVTEQIYSILPNKPDMSESKFYMIGFGNNRYENKAKPIGNFNYLGNVEGESYNLKFHAVLNDSVDVDIVLGKQFCLPADIRITPTSVDTRKFDESVPMLKINVFGDHNLKIDETVRPQVKKSVAEMINSY